ncbi:MAG: hypothetical protein LBC87_02325 [Fibromonadaceae bacterium]|jgi:hypothetical protein|nr:hypothetical protein [Fibromonadaceae bacterium]
MAYVATAPTEYLADELAKPIVKKQKIGFLKDKISIPTNFDSMGRKEIENLFS